jgi:hypothetical protein
MGSILTVTHGDITECMITLIFRLIIFFAGVLKVIRYEGILTLRCATAEESDCGTFGFSFAILGFLLLIGSASELAEIIRRL